MKILDVELVKDPEMGWCYVVKTSHKQAPNTHSMTYVVLKSVMDRHKCKLFNENTDLTDVRKWDKLFRFISFNGWGSRDNLKKKSSISIEYRGTYGNFTQPMDSKLTSEVVFELLNKGGCNV